MSPSVAPHAARQGSQNDTEMTATDPDAKCFRQHVPSVAKIPKYPLNLVPVDRCIVAIATVKSDRVDRAVSNFGAYIGWDTLPMYAPARMGWCVMSLEVSIREGESQDSLLRRFQRVVQTSGILREVKAHRYFLSKGEASRLKAKKSARRRQKQLASN